MRKFFDWKPDETGSASTGTSPGMSKESAEQQSVQSDGLASSPGPGHHATMSEPPAGNRELSFGERAVGLSFNPGNNYEVNEIKRAFADTIDLLNYQREKTTNSEVKRMLSIAITESQTAQMWAVKAVTWNS